VILLQHKLIKLKVKVFKSDFQRKKERYELCTQINLQLTGKLSLEFDFSSSLLL